METLVQLCITCEALLRSVGETFWADKLQSVVKKGVGRLDCYLLEEILSWYGSMGSFNDLIISECNGHVVKNKDEEEQNVELNRLRTQIYQEAVRLKQGYNFVVAK